MKKNIKQYAILGTLFFIFFILSACHSHEHSFGAWEWDEFKHWQQCDGCDKKQNNILHTYGNWVVVREATEDSVGERKRTCSVCGYVQIAEISLVPHDHVYGPWEITIYPTTSSEGTISRRCNSSYPHTETDTLPNLNRIDYTYEILRESTCGEVGIERYTYIKDGQQINVDIEMEKLEHSFSQKWSFDSKYHWHAAICEHKDEKKDYGVHTIEEGICSICQMEEAPEDHTHEYKEWEIVDAPTIATPGLIKRVCMKNSAHIEYDDLPILNKNDYTYNLLLESTCDKEGQEEYTFVKVEQRIVVIVNLPKLSHTYEAIWSYDGTHHWYAATCEHKNLMDSYEEHSFAAGVCEICKYVNYSKGLEFEMNTEDKGYTLTGMGTVQDSEIIIPSYYEGLPVTVIGSSAFANCSSITKVTLLDGIETIEASAFANCINLKEVILPSTLKKVEKYAFEGCSALETIELPQELEFLDDYVFYNCKSIETIELSNSLIYLGDNVFNGCAILRYEAYENGYYLGNAKNPYLALILIDDTLMEEFSIHKDTVFIYSGVFTECRQLKWITIPQKVIQIGMHGFSYCERLEYIIIQSKELTIYQSAFSHCSKLEKVFYDGTQEEWDRLILGEYNEGITSSTIYFYSSSSSNQSGNYWHYSSDNLPLVWNEE